MKVKVANNLYKMTRQEYQGLRQIASDQVPLGIYAVEKNNYAELRNDKCDSVTQLKKLIQEYKAKGFKVRQNGR